MAPAATTVTFGGNPTNLAYTLGQGLDSRPKSKDTSIIFVVGNDSSERELLESLRGCEGWQLETFESAQEFLVRPRLLVPNCLVLSLSYRDLNGLEAQKQIARERAETPIIITSYYGDVPTSVHAMKAGAIDFLVKPCSHDILLAAIRQSLERSRVSLPREMEMLDLRNCYASLTPRERQVMALVVSGLLNKQVGGELGISEITVKAHRGQVMKKMKANSLADLVRTAAKLRSSRQAIHPA